MAINSSIISLEKRRVVLIDAAILAVVYSIPTLSHALSVPLYLFEPMRMALFVSILFLPDRKNAYLLAITLPLFSYIVSGHPVVVKNAIIAIELLANVFILYRLLEMNFNYFISCFVSIIASKILYYSLKYFVIYQGLFATKLIDTSIIVQLLISCLLSLAFWSIYNKRDKRING